MVLLSSCATPLHSLESLPSGPTQLCIPVNSIHTTERCRREFYKTRCICGEICKEPMVEITYVTVDKCGKEVEWSRTYHADKVPSIK